MRRRVLQTGAVMACVILGVVAADAAAQGIAPPQSVLLGRRYVAPGTLVGTVIAADTRAPLPGVEVTIEVLDARMLTDGSGRYRLSDVPAGSYTVVFAHIGYRRQARTDVVVRPDRITREDVELAFAPIDLPAIASAVDYFAARGGERDAGHRVGFSAEEIRRAPGSAGDVSRILMGLPALAKVNDQSNALIVRGGSPLENAFLVDGIEIPNINHFPTQGASGGPIGILNVDLIEDVELHTGAFPARYGDRLSSVMEIRLREGNREDFDAQLDLNFAGFGGVAEGPLAGGRGSWVLTARRSYLDLLVKAIDVGTTVAPRFGDLQAKAAFDVSPAHALAALAIVSGDHNDTDYETALENAMLQFGRQDIVQGTVGASWSALWSDRVWSRTSVSLTTSRFREELRETASDAPLLKNRSTEREVRLRNVNRLRAGSGSTIELGFEVKRVEADYDNRYAEHIGPLGDTVAAVDVDARPRVNRLGAFASWQLAATPRLTTTFGIRADISSHNDRVIVGPRASIAYRLTDRTTVNAGAGIFRQALPLVLLAQSAGHRDLGDPEAFHLVAGIDYRLADDARLTAEGYWKSYSNLPVDPAQPALSTLDELIYDFGFFNGHERLDDGGRATAAGIEATLQKKLSRKFYGLASAAYARSRYRASDGVWRDRAFDNRYLVSLEGGYRTAGAWQLSARWIYAGGPPYTPLDLDASRAANRAVLDATRINAGRYPDYHSLNVRADRRFHFARSSLVAYASIWNAYNRRNIASYYWNAEESGPGVIRQWGLLPIFGFEMEF